MSYSRGMAASVHRHTWNPGRRPGHGAGEPVFVGKRSGRFARALIATVVLCCSVFLGGPGARAADGQAGPPQGARKPPHDRAASPAPHTRQVPDQCPAPQKTDPKPPPQDSSALTRNPPASDNPQAGPRKATTPQQGKSRIRSLERSLGDVDNTQRTIRHTIRRMKRTINRMRRLR